MHLLAVSLLSILAGTLLLAKFRKEAMGKFFVFISWFFIVVGFVLFIGFIGGGICRLTHHEGFGPPCCKHEMMQKCDHRMPGSCTPMGKGMCPPRPGCCCCCPPPAGGMPTDSMMKCCPEHMRHDTVKMPQGRK
jgi:hypothetical protein